MVGIREAKQSGPWMRGIAMNDHFFFCMLDGSPLIWWSSMTGYSDDGYRAKKRKHLTLYQQFWRYVLYRQHSQKIIFEMERNELRLPTWLSGSTHVVKQEMDLDWPSLTIVNPPTHQPINRQVRIFRMMGRYQDRDQLIRRLSLQSVVCIWLFRQCSIKS